MGHPMGKSKKHGRGKTDFYYRNQNKQKLNDNEEFLDKSYDNTYIEEDEEYNGKD